MIIAFSARGPGPDFDLDESFGRAYWLVIRDEQNGTWDAVDNRENRAALENAGVRAVRILVDWGVRVLVTGKVGPRAYRHLQAGGIEVYLAMSGSPAELLEQWRDQGLTLALAPNSQGSPYCLMDQRKAVTSTMMSTGDRERSAGAPTWKGRIP